MPDIKTICMYTSHVHTCMHDVYDDQFPVIDQVHTFVYTMLNKNSLAVKKVQGQSEATMVISDQKL